MARTVLGDLEAFIVEHQTEQENAREQLLERFTLSFAYSRAHPEITRFFSYFDFTYSRASQTPTELARHQEVKAARQALATRSTRLFLAGQADWIDRPGFPPPI